MYVIRNQSDDLDRVVLGPKSWDKYEFQDFLWGRYNISFPLQWANPNDKIIEVNDSISIWPVIYRSNPDYNKRTQFLDGPFYDYSETHAEHYMVVEELDVAQAQSRCREAVKNAKDAAIEEGTSHTIDGVNYQLLPKDLQAYKNGIPGQWKLKEITDSLVDNGLTRYTTARTFVDLSQDDLDGIVSALQTYIQGLFDIEKQQFEDINDFTTLDEIDSHSFPDGVTFAGF